MHFGDHVSENLRNILTCARQDFERERNPERVLQSMSLKRFAALIFRECPGLEPFAGSLDKIYKAFAEYKQVRSKQRHVAAVGCRKVSLFCGCNSTGAHATIHRTVCTTL